MSGIKDKVVIITGASSGLGEATARLLAERGAKLMLAARREDRLQSLAGDIEEAGGTVAYRVTDVIDRDQVEALAQATLKEYGQIDVLFNNAGLMPLSPLDALKVEDWERMVDVNIKGVLYGIAAVLPHMRERKTGQIINMSSIAGHKVFPASAVYSATKYAVRAISEGLRQESNGDFRVMNVSPGAIATELTNTISDASTAESVDELYEVAIGAAAIARAIAYAIEQPDDVDVNELIIRPTKQPL
ncbi:MAG: SDR family oxidoreductase [Gammaproteobacteria bacterium]|nr:SDR family oxidoreductase [Gammaproteobacteria bacterium]